MFVFLTAILSHAFHFVRGEVSRDMTLTWKMPFLYFYHFLLGKMINHRSSASGLKLVSQELLLVYFDRLGPNVSTIPITAMDHLFCNHFSRKVQKSGFRKVVLQTQIFFFWSTTFLEPDFLWIYGIKPPFFLVNHFS